MMMDNSISNCVGFPENRKAVLNAMGLRKLHETVYREVTPTMAGMIYRVKEILKVEVVSSEQMKAELAQKAIPKKPFFSLIHLNPNANRSINAATTTATATATATTAAALRS